MPREEIFKAITAVSDNLKIWKDQWHDDLRLMQHDSIHHQIQLTAIRLWWNHAVILILSTEQEFDDIVDAVAKDSMLMFEDMDSAVKSFFRYEEYLTDWAFRKTPILSFIGLI